MKPKPQDDGRLRLTIFILAIVVVILVLFPWPFWVDRVIEWIAAPSLEPWRARLKSFPNEAVGTAFLTFLLTQAAQEWYGIRKQRKEILSSLLDTDFVVDGLSDQIKKGIFRASIEGMTRDKSFADDLNEILEKKIVKNGEMRRNYRVTCSLKADKEPSDLIEFFYYDLIQRVEYDCVISSEVRDFFLIGNQEVYSAQRTGDGTEHRCLVHPSWIVGDRLQDMFSVETFSIDGERLERSEVQIDRDVIRTRYEIPKRLIDGKAHRISYVLREKILKRGHQRVLHIRVPTFGFYCEFDYSDTDISYVDCMDLIASKGKAVIQRVPKSKPFKVVLDLQESWALPGSGVLLTWQRKYEKEQEYAIAGRRFPDRKDDLKNNL